MKRQKKKSFAIELVENVSDPSKTKECYQSYFKNKKWKIVKMTKNKFLKPKIIENANIADMKSAIIVHPNFSHKLSKTISKAENVS